MAAENAKVSVFDRGFLYGDGLFETLRIYDSEPFLWEEHIGRFLAGAQFLKIVPPLSSGEMRRVAGELLVRNGMKEAVLRITLSRGVGPRGYSPEGAEDPLLVLTPHAVPAASRRNFSVVTSSIKLHSLDPLAAVKSSNKLSQILARREADEQGADEALFLNQDGYVIEATSANLFWMERATLCTPPLNSGILPGITRGYVLQLAAQLGIRTKEKNVRLNSLLQADAIFLTSSVSEIREVKFLNLKRVKTSLVVKKLKKEYQRRTREG